MMSLKEIALTEILRIYPHPNILVTPNDENCLRDCLPILTEENKKTIADELILAVKHLHLHGIVHQSISIDNIFLSKLYDVYSIGESYSVYVSHLSGFSEIDLFPTLFSNAQFSADVFSLGFCLREIFTEIPEDHVLFINDCLLPEPSQRPQLNKEIILPNLPPSPFPVEVNVIEYLLSLVPALNLNYSIVWKTLRLYSALPKKKGIDLPICLSLLLKMKNVSIDDWLSNFDIPKKYLAKREEEIIERYLYILISPCPLEICLIRENLINFNILVDLYLRILRSPLFNMLSTMEVSDCLLEKSCLPCISYSISEEQYELLKLYS